MNEQNSKKYFFIFWIEKKRKEYFLDHKRKVLKNCKKSTFCKGVSPWFFQKIDLFLICVVFLGKKARKKHYFIFWIEKNRRECFLDHKKEVLKNSKKSTFCKGVSQKIDLFLIFFFDQKKARKKHLLIFWIEKNAF